jgi:hypothetical protein
MTTTHFCPEHCCECPDCLETLQEYEAEHEARYDLGYNEWESHATEPEVSVHERGEEADRGR